MSEHAARSLVALLKGPALRCRTGILLLPLDQLGREPDVAARLGVDAVDYAEILRRAVAPGSQFAGISAEREEQLLSSLSDSPKHGPCLLVYNIDLALARMDTLERDRFWTNLFDNLPNRRRALLLTLPREARHLLPQGESLEAWRSAGRTALLVEAPE